MRDVASVLKVPLSTVHHLIKKEKILVQHTNVMKPSLSDKHMANRLLFAREQIRKNKQGELEYHDFYDTIHVDEKQFTLTEITERFYGPDTELKKKKSCKHKSHIDKIMFLAVNVRPRFDSKGKCIFDGKIGLFPFVRRVKAKRNSKNRQAGTWELKAVNVTRDTYLEIMTKKSFQQLKQSGLTKTGQSSFNRTMHLLILN